MQVFGETCSHNYAHGKLEHSDAIDESHNDIDSILIGSICYTANLKAMVLHHCY